jgi:tRNA-specific 2-thiouridylase
VRVLAAMSGGVDSAVAAARAVAAGWDVTGVHLALSRQPATLRTGSRGCCSVEDSNDARRTADILGIPFYVWDFSERFAADVIDDFVSEYAAGRTPNPCLRCNEKIKFAALLDRALALGFDAVVTGHHARLADGRLSRSVDAAKDQSYVLAVLTPGQLAHAVFPLGDSTKDQVRAEAARLGLAVAAKPDSHDICFIADGDTQAFLDRRLGERPGDIVDTDGTVLGSHAGSHRFTVGQRRGLNLTRPSATGEPRYVLSISPKTNTVVVGGADDLLVGLVRCGPPVWIAEPPSGSVGSVQPVGLGQPVGVSQAFAPFECEVQLRAHGMVSPARIVADGAGLRAVLGVPQRGVAAGQALVMYDGDRVLGSATILGTERPDDARPAAERSAARPAAGAHAG